MMSRNPASILLIEDNPGDARLLREMLAEAKETRFALVTASTLAEGIAHLDKEDFVLVLLDLSLPDSAGFETFESVRLRHGSVPIIVLTGLDDAQLGVRAVQDGAQDYLVKNQVDARRLVHSLHYALGRHGRQRRIEENLQTTLHEIETARKIQQHLFPKQAPACHGFEIYGASYPAAATGGDYFDYLPMTNGNLGIVIGDVTGHGLGPAMLMAATRAYLRAFTQMHSDVGCILTLANRVIANDFGEDRNITLLLGALDPQRRSFVYSSAGHETGYLLSHSGALKAEFFSTDLPLGIVADGEFSVAATVFLEPGDVLLLFTDGITDAWSANGGRFGHHRVLDVARANCKGHACDVVNGLFHAARQHSMAQEQLDDMTAVAVKSLGSGQEA